MKEHNQNIQPEDAAPVRLPIYLRWPVIVICLFIWAPVSTIVGAILWIWRLIFNHSHPQFRLKPVPVWRRQQMQQQPLPLSLECCACREHRA